MDILGDNGGRAVWNIGVLRGHITDLSSARRPLAVLARRPSVFLLNAAQNSSETEIHFLFFFFLFKPISSHRQAQGPIHSTHHYDLPSCFVLGWGRGQATLKIAARLPGLLVLALRDVEEVTSFPHAPVFSRMSE